MQSVQESKQELEASIRYAENAISSAKATIESMEFRQEMAKKQHSEQTGREEALTKLVKELEETNEKLANDNYNLEREVAELRDIIDRMSDDATGDSVTIKLLNEENANLKAEVNALEQPERPTMPVIPKEVAIAIFREGIQTGVLSACAELEGQSINIEESEYCGDFEVSFTRYIQLDDELDLDWMRGKCGDYTEDAVIDSLKGLCADKEFECRIHGVDDPQTKENAD